VRSAVLASLARHRSERHRPLHQKPGIAERLVHHTHCAPAGQGDCGPRPGRHRLPGAQEGGRDAAVPGVWRAGRLGRRAGARALGAGIGGRAAAPAGRPAVPRQPLRPAWACSERAPGRSNALPAAAAPGPGRGPPRAPLPAPPRRPAGGERARSGAGCRRGGAAAGAGDGLRHLQPQGDQEDGAGWVALGWRSCLRPSGRGWRGRPLPRAKLLRAAASAAGWGGLLHGGAPWRASRAEPPVLLAAPAAQAAPPAWLWRASSPARCWAGCWRTGRAWTSCRWGWVAAGGGARPAACLRRLPAGCPQARRTCWLLMSAQAVTHRALSGASAAAAAADCHPPTHPLPRPRRRRRALRRPACLWPSSPSWPRGWARCSWSRRGGGWRGACSGEWGRAAGRPGSRTERFDRVGGGEVCRAQREGGGRGGRGCVLQCQASK
jgi:hypothetical protein